MTRTIVGFLGVLAALFPDRMVAVFEAIAVENPDACVRRRWVGSVIRLEGVVVSAVSLLGGRAFSSMMNLTGIFGVVVFLFPRLYRRLAASLLYEEPRGVEWDDRFADRVRAIGLLYVLLAAWTPGRRRADDRRRSRRR